MSDYEEISREDFKTALENVAFRDGDVEIGKADVAREVEKVFGPEARLPSYTRAQLVNLLKSFDTVIRDEWFRQECESANYHSLHDWIRENFEQVKKELLSR